MGLFDNLFLDANTPITINDGIDHSKDTIASATAPSDTKPPSGGASKGDDGTSSRGGTTGDDTKSSGGSSKADEEKSPTKNTAPKKDDSLVTLFDDGKIEQEKSEKILHPEPPKDIALEIGLPPQVIDQGEVTKDMGVSGTGDTPMGISSDGASGDTSVSFDIGGDLGFDIGGDFGSPLEASPMLGVQDGAQDLAEHGVTFLDESQPSIEVTHIEESTAGSESTHIQDGESTEVSLTQKAPSGDAISTDSVKANDAKSGTISDASTKKSPTQDTKSVAPPGENTPSTLSTPLTDTRKSPTPEAENALFSLLNTPSTDSSSHDTPIEGSTSSNLPPPPKPTPSSSPSLLDLMAEDDIPPVPSETTMTVGAPTEAATQETGALPATINEAIGNLIESLGSNKLKDKLTEFLSELENIEVGEESQIEHKRQQIEMCKSRINEIKSEYDARIHGLQVELQALEKEIHDIEKGKIKIIIENFQKELEHV